MRTRAIAVMLLILPFLSVGPGLGGQMSSQDGGAIEAVTSVETIVPLAAGATSIDLTFPTPNKADFGTIKPGDNSKTSSLKVTANGGWKLKVNGANLYNSQRAISLSQPLRVSVLNPSNSNQRTTSISLSTSDSYILEFQNAVTNYDLVPIYSQLVTSSDHVYSNHNSYSTSVTWTAEPHTF
jgi:hypothetical protein